MTWGELKRNALQLIFSNEGPALSVDDINEEYINAMPGVTNAGLQQLLLAGVPMVKRWIVTIDPEATEDTVTDSGVTLPAQSGYYHLDMRVLLPAFRCVHRGQVMLETADGYGNAPDWQMEGDTVLRIPGSVVGVYTVFYRAYPQTITANTQDTEEIDAPAEGAALLPLYVASELYKDDDLSLATVLRNEFEDGLQKIRAAYEEFASVTVTERKCETGWW